MHTSSRALRRHRLLLLPAVLALPCVIAAPSVAAAHTRPAPAVTAPASFETSDAQGPWFHGTTLDFGEGRMAYTDTASGFDATGAYFRRQALLLGGDGGPHYEETASHS
ncbi:hypothetical protein ABT127_05075 [Streptomyces sp. NPDC001904]|uniref:hypothetical protein n=1 Tax=Streptomyces sp. NPDC001904 TaxID=3154531 RepID=UPI00331F0C44